MHGENFSATMREVTAPKVAAVAQQTESMFELQRAKDEAAATRARERNEHEQLSRLIDMYRDSDPGISPSKAVEKAEDAMARARARRAQ